MKKKILLAIILGSCSFASFSQAYKVYEKWLFHLNVGYNAFYGDVTDNTNKVWNNTPLTKYYYEDRKLMYGLMFGKEISPSFSVKMQGLWGELGSRQTSKKRYFGAEVFEFNVHGTANLLTLLSKERKRVFDLNLFVGLGICSFRSAAYTSTGASYLYSYGYTEMGKNKSSTVVETVIPFGLGITYKIGKNWKITAETSLRYVMTDKLDAISEPGNSFEGYSYNSIGVAYVFDMSFLENNPFRWRKAGGFRAQEDNSASIYNRGTSNGSVKSDPFKGRRKSKNYVYRKKGRKFLGIF